MLYIQYILTLWGSVKSEEGGRRPQTSIQYWLRTYVTRYRTTVITTLTLSIVVSKAQTQGTALTYRECADSMHARMHVCTTRVRVSVCRVVRSRRHSRHQYLVAPPRRLLAPLNIHRRAESRGHTT